MRTALTIRQVKDEGIVEISFHQDAGDETMALANVPVSAVIVCLNESRLIAKCLESLSFCAEIVIVDSGSTDGTLGIIEDFAAAGYPIRLIARSWEGYAPQKDFALKQADNALVPRR